MRAAGGRQRSRTFSEAEAEEKRQREEEKERAERGVGTMEGDQATEQEDGNITANELRVEVCS